MNKQDLVGLGIDETVAEQIIVLHGKDIEKFKTLPPQIEALQTQLTEANNAIAGFKELDPEGLKTAVEDWKIKAEEIRTEAEEKVFNMQFDTKLELALHDAGAKNSRAVSALLDYDKLEFAEDGTPTNLATLLDEVKAENEYLFDSNVENEEDPQIVAGGESHSVLTDKLVSAARQGAGLKE